MSINTFIHKRASVLRVTALAAALCVSGLVVAQASYSVNDTVSNNDNSWTTGAVDVKEFNLDSDVKTTMFTGKDLHEGDHGTKYITLTEKGQKSGNVKMYFTGIDKTKDDLNQWLEITVTPGKFGKTSISGFTPTGTPKILTLKGAEDVNSYDEGILPSTLGEGDSTSYKIDYIVKKPAASDAPDLPGNTKATANFVWQIK